VRISLLDTGPVVAFLSTADVHHDTTIRALRASDTAGRRFCTSWEVVGEAYTLMRIRGAPNASGALALEVLRWAWESGVTILGATESDHSRAGDVLGQHPGLRLSYVDALLLALAERHQAEEVVTADGHHFPAVSLAHTPTVTVV
jgi:predicted nucleic acid-binding protein